MEEGAKKKEANNDLCLCLDCRLLFIYLMNGIDNTNGKGIQRMATEHLI